MQLHRQPTQPVDIYESLRHSDDPSYLLTVDLELIATNDGWNRFARENNGGDMLARWPPGTSILSAISEDLRAFYAGGYRRAHRLQRRWDFDYECCSAHEFRMFRMVVYPAHTCLLVTHSRLIRAPLTRLISPPSDDYLVNGVIRMCSHCRRVHRASTPEHWDWVPAFIEQMPSTVSHGLCPACKAFYYGR